MYRQKDHLIYECETKTKERKRLKKKKKKKGKWPINKKDLIRMHYKEIVKFINFDNLTQNNNRENN
jgi:hypothetical protein